MSQRQTHCRNGHLFTVESTYTWPDGRRCCKTCRRERRRRYVKGLAAKGGAGEAQRDQFGVIVTAREIETGSVRTLHESGLRTEALRIICTRLDALEGEWRIVSCSTPETIRRDLQGHRLQKVGRRVGHVDFPERNLLGHIGRLDLLDVSECAHRPSKKGT